jgi:IPT/TIG domain-containing protein
MMKTIQIVLLSSLIACTLACGYSSKAASPPSAGPMPAIAQLVPPSMNSGGQSFALTVNGSNFAAKATVNLNQTAQTNTTFVSANQLTVMIPASAIATPGTIKISVTNPGTPGMGAYGGGGTLPETSTLVNFTVN